jgi:hypothetical protein
MLDLRVVGALLQEQATNEVLSFAVTVTEELTLGAAKNWSLSFGSV